MPNGDFQCNTKVWTIYLERWNPVSVKTSRHRSLKMIFNFLFLCFFGSPKLWLLNCNSDACTLSSPRSCPMWKHIYLPPIFKFRNDCSNSCCSKISGLARQTTKPQLFHIKPSRRCFICIEYHNKTEQFQEKWILFELWTNNCKM